MNKTNFEFETNSLNWIGMIFIRCYCFLMIPLAIIGHSLSIIVFTRRKLRTNPCVMYLRAATIFGFLTSCFILPMRLIQSGYVDLDPATYSNIFCKLIWFLLYSIRSLSYWLVALACIDRYLCSSSSMTKRSWSSTYVASRSIPLIILIIFLLYIHIPIYFQIYLNSITNKLICHSAGPSGSYRKLLSIFNLIIFGISPSLCMLIFGILTLQNIYQKQTFDVLISSDLKTFKLPEKQLLRMLFIQVLVFSLSGMLFSISFIIIAMNKKQEQTLHDIAKENLIIAIVGMLSNTGPCLSFYLFTLSSQLFRKELKRFFNQLLRKQTQLIEDYSLNSGVNSTVKP